MDEPPRRATDRILSRRRVARLLRIGAVMAAGTLAVLAWSTAQWGAAVGATMAFTTFVLFQVVNALNARVETGSVFNRHLLTNRWLWIALGCVLLLQVAAVQSSWLKQIFDTVPLTLAQWLVCAAVAATVLMVEEQIRVAARVTADQPPRPRDVTTSPSPQL